ncbi:MAG: PilN domain-containing protein [Candidatus Omnitrophica bacterium]|nr:PilN domain-containing protein [Candidatus Omnitrophota bacterium]
MININLIPPHLRKKEKGRLLGKVSIPLEIIIGCGGGLLVLLGVVHVLLLFVNIGKLAQHKALQKQWENMRPGKENVDSVVNEMRKFQGKYKAIEDIGGENSLSWAQKLNILSDNLPRGVWLKKIDLSEDTLFIEGSAISKETSEIISIHHFTANLKQDGSFMEHFTDLELGSIQRRKIKNVEIADFVITMKVK